MTKLARAATYHLQVVAKYIRFERDGSLRIFSCAGSKAHVYRGIWPDQEHTCTIAGAIRGQSTTPVGIDGTVPAAPARSMKQIRDPAVQMQLRSRSIAMPDLHKIHESDDAQARRNATMMRHGPHHITLD